MAKKILHGEEARDKIQRGLDILANTVKCTLGPRGRNVVIEKPIGPPTITKDGVTVAKEVHLEDPLENMGAQLVRQAASKTADDAGDGTTTATLLAQSIFTKGLRLLATGSNPVALKRGIDGAVDVTIAELKRFATKVSKEDIAAVGTISANGDRAIGRIVADALDKVGLDGVVALEESRDHETHLVVVDGMEFDRGYISPWFMTNAEKNICELKDCAILITDRKIGHFDTLLPILTRCSQENLPILIIAEDVEGVALAMQVDNKREGKLRICSVRTPSYGDDRRERLIDIATLTGAYVFTADSGRKLPSVELNDLGAASRVVVSRTSTTIVGGKGDPKAIQDRIASIREQISASQEDREIDLLKQRLAKLTGGVASVQVGAPTEAEMVELKARVEDAIHATRAAAEEGIVPGGGVALLRCAEAVSMLVEALDGDEQHGAQIVLESLEAPLRTICENAAVDPETVIQTVKVPRKSPNYGYNAQSGVYEDLIQAQVIDPVKVTRLALQNAASVASVMLTTEALISEIRTPSHGPALQGRMPA